MDKTQPLKQDLIDDFHAWLDDLGEEEQANVDTIPDCIDLLPKFCQKWTVAQLWSAIRDR